MLAGIGNLFLLLLIGFLCIAIFTTLIREIFESFFRLISLLGDGLLFFSIAIFLFLNSYKSPNIFFYYGLGFLSIII